MFKSVICFEILKPHPFLIQVIDSSLEFFDFIANLLDRPLIVTQLMQHGSYNCYRG